MVKISTKPGREADDFANAKLNHGEKPSLIYVISYVPELYAIPERFKDD
jgi:hypothetical protein